MDSTGIKFLGDGEWQARKHGVQGRRQSLPGNGLPANRERGRKVHLAMDTATAIIPIRKNGRPWKEDCPAAIVRNETLRATLHYGRAFLKRWTRYHV